MAREVVLKSRLPAIAVEAHVRVNAAVGQAADVIAEKAKARVPVRTGLLRSRIHAAEVPDEPSPYVKEQPDEGWYVVGGDSDAWYGHFVELGTVHAPPHPFLVPAAEASKKELAALVSLSLKGL